MRKCEAFNKIEKIFMERLRELWIDPNSLNKIKEEEVNRLMLKVNEITRQGCKRRY